MADLVSSIKIILSGGDAAASELRGINSDISKLGSVATGLAQPFADLAKYVEILDAAIVGLATVAIVKSTKEAATFQSSLFDLQKQLDSTEGSARDQAGALEEMAQKYGVNANDLVKSTADFKAAGYDLDTSLKLVEGSLDLMIAGGVKAADAVDIMNRSLAGFQVPASQVVTEATHMGDVINKTADLTKSSFVEISRGFADFSPVAKITGLSIEETAAIMSKVIDVFGSGSEAANSLKSGFISLVTPSSEASAELLKLGVSVTDSAGKFRSTKDILADLAPAFAKLTDAEQLHAAGVIFGTHQAGKFVQVLSTYSDAMALAKRLTDEAGGSIEKEVTIRLQAAEVQFNRTVEAIRQLEVHFGLQFLESTAEAAGGVTDLTNAFKQLVDNNAFAPFIDLIKEGANSIGDTLRAMARNLPQAFAAVDFSGLLSSINGLGDELGNLFKALFGNIDLTTVEGLASALQTLTNIGDGLVLTTTGIVRAFEPFAEAIRGMVSGFGSLDSASKVDFGQFIGDIQAIVKAGGLVAGAIVGMGQAAIDISPIFDVVFGGIKVAVNALQITFDAVVLGLLNIKKTLLEAGLSVAEFGQNFALTDAAKSQNQAAIDSFKASLSSLEVTMDSVSANLERNKNELDQGWVQATGKASDKTEELRRRLDETKSSISGNRDEIIKNNSAMQDWSTGIQQAADSAKNTSVEINKVTEAQKESDKSLPDGTKISLAYHEAGLQAGVYATAVGGLGVQYEQAGVKTVKATGYFKAVTDATAEQTKKIDEAVKKSQEYQLKMEEIASNERIKTIEANVKLNVAELEAQTKQVEAAFKSIDTTISSTGDLLGSLFGNLASADTYTKLQIEDQIELENQRRQKALDLQTKLTEAEIEKIQAQTDALNRGDGTIKINAEGMEPEIKAFMYKILKLIRIETSRDVSNYLLGLNPT